MQSLNKERRRLKPAALFAFISLFNAAGDQIEESLEYHIDPCALQDEFGSLGGGGIRLILERSAAPVDNYWLGENHAVHIVNLAADIEHIRRAHRVKVKRCLAVGKLLLCDYFAVRYPLHIVGVAGAKGDLMALGRERIHLCKRLINALRRMDVLLGAYCAARNYGVRCTEELAPLHAGAYRLVRHLVEHEIHKAAVEPARRVGIRARKAEHCLAVGQAAGQQAVPHHAVVCGHRGEAVDRLYAEAGGVTQ